MAKKGTMFVFIIEIFQVLYADENNPGKRENIKFQEKERLLEQIF